MASAVDGCNSPVRRLRGFLGGKGAKQGAIYGGGGGIGLTRDRDVGKRFDRLIEVMTDSGRRIGSTVGVTTVSAGLGLGMLQGKDGSQGKDRGMHLRGRDPFHLGHDTLAGRGERRLGGGMAMCELEAPRGKGKRARLGESERRPLFQGSGGLRMRLFQR